ncbi:MAG: hypothetical protein ACYTF1_09740, partial [Planctomycetota bacterium]
VAAVVVVRLLGGAVAGLDLAATGLLVFVAVVLGRSLLVERVWPKGALVVAVAVVTAIGVYLRADRFDQVLGDSERKLPPDVRYYHQQAMKTGNPFAAGFKSPLWAALHAPLVRIMDDGNLAMRVLSWGFGALMLPLTALVVGRLFEPIVGVIVAGLLAVDPWLVDLCCEGLREELGLCLWMVVFLLLFEERAVSWRRVVAVGLIGGVLLLLRNIAVVPLMVLTFWAIVSRRWPVGQALTGLLLPIALVMPFYVNQWRVYGDAFAMEKRDARYHANLEFNEASAPSGLTMPTAEEKWKNLYAGEPISPLAYLVGHRSFSDFVSKQGYGLRRVVLGGPFHFQTSGWLQLVCAAGLVATLFVKQQRFAALFVLASVLGIRAHLLAVNQLELRLLLPVMVVWLAAGWWLMAAAVRWGGRRWIETSASRKSTNALE